MKFFAETITKPYIEESKYRRLCEIGSSFGDNANELLKLADVTLDLIDPCLDADLALKYKSDVRVSVHKGISLEILPTLKGSFDCIFIDGDHNWYTVYHELKAIADNELLRVGGTIFFHDVMFPYGRRDMYYQPEMIPAEYRQPYAMKGIVQKQSALVDENGVNSHLHNATHEGGKRNGVLTAIEDFIKDSDDSYQFFHIKHEYGLGVMLRGNASGVFTKYKRRATYENLKMKIRAAASVRQIVKTLSAK